MLCKLSTLSRWVALTGTPIIGTVVLGASISGKAAVPPAAAMRTRIPRLVVDLASSLMRWGVWWAVVQN
jgi:hypothetical protein